MQLHKNASLAMLGGGLVLHFFYVLSVGGDYMCGRFFALMAWVAVVMLHWRFGAYPLRPLALRVGALALLALAVQPLVTSGSTYYGYNISDQRLKSYRSLSIFVNQRLWADKAVPEDEQESGNLDYRYGMTRFIGRPGFYAPSASIIIDANALSDALLARLPADPGSFKIGHLVRDMPKGYALARMNGDMSQMSPPLAQYYGKLRLVTSGDLFSYNRIVTILDFQLGLYDHWLAEYVQSAYGKRQP